MSFRLLRLLPALLLLLAARPLLAQTYEPGWLVRANGDTLRGELENDFWVEAPTFVRYRPAAASPSQLLPARQLRAFGFAGGRHFRREVLLLDRAAETRLQDLRRGNVVTLLPDTVLAEVLLAGPAELLRVARPGAVHYEVRRPDRPALHLSERKYLAESKTGAWRVVDGNNYKNELALYFIDCPAASQAASTAAFTATGLATVVQAYASGCAPGRQPARSWVTQAAPRRRGAFQAGVLAGGRYNRIESSSRSVAGCTDCQPHPFGGLYAELLQPSRTTAFYGELSVSPFRSRGTRVLYIDPTGGAVYANYDYRGLLATARLGVRFLLPLPRDQQVVLGLGFEYNEVLGTGLPRSSSNVYNYNAPATASDAYASPTILPNLTLGWRHQRLTLLTDLQLYRSRTEDGLSSIYVSGNGNVAVRLGASYRLGRHPDATAPRRAARP